MYLTKKKKNVFSFGNINLVTLTLDLEENVLTSKSLDGDEELKRKAAEFDRLMKIIKDKIPQVSYREKI